eukprot:m.234830 g.234830  ORF g.234830 m.234830 type:complete len:145 (+) comp40120_c0_seq4:1059-1493(+)
MFHGTHDLQAELASAWRTFTKTHEALRIDCELERSKGGKKELVPGVVGLGKLVPGLMSKEEFAELEKFIQVDVSGVSSYKKYTITILESSTLKMHQKETTTQLKSKLEAVKIWHCYVVPRCEGLHRAKDRVLFPVQAALGCGLF